MNSTDNSKESVLFLLPIYTHLSLPNEKKGVLLLEVETHFYLNKNCIVKFKFK